MQEAKKKRLLTILFFLYIIILIRLIIFKYPTDYLMNVVKSWESNVVWEGLETANFTLGKSIRMYIKYFPDLNGFENLFGNILVFVPFGYLLPCRSEKYHRWWRVLILSLLFVSGIELFQLISAFGAFDVDDILLNVAGAMGGYALKFCSTRVKL